MISFSRVLLGDSAAQNNLLEKIQWGEKVSKVNNKLLSSSPNLSLKLKPVGGLVQMIERDETFNEDKTGTSSEDKKDDTFNKDKTGTFNEDKTKELIASNIALDGFAVVSIIGPQSSGKSYLLNQIFGTKFEAMDAKKRRGQTTQGLWMSMCEDPSVLVVDVEGCDSAENGEDNGFERKAALLALTISDVVIINIWLHGIGREAGGCNALLRIVFKERIELKPARTKLVIVIRDYDYETTFGTLKQDIKTKMQQLWELTNKDASPNFLFDDYFEVFVVALPSKREVEDFNGKVSLLKKWICEADVAGSRQDKSDASEFAASSKLLWETINKNERLNLPKHADMVSEHMCMQAFDHSKALIDKNEDYWKLQNGKCASPVVFRNSAKSLEKTILDEYDNKTRKYKYSHRQQRHKELKENIITKLEGPSRALMRHVRLKIVDDIKKKSLQNLDASNHERATENITQISLQTLENMLQGLSKRFPGPYEENKEELIEFIKNFVINQLRINMERAKQPWRYTIRWILSFAAHAALYTIASPIKIVDPEKARIFYDGSIQAYDNIAGLIENFVFGVVDDLAYLEPFTDSSVLQIEPSDDNPIGVQERESITSRIGVLERESITSRIGVQERESIISIILQNVLRIVLWIVLRIFGFGISLNQVVIACKAALATILVLFIAPAYFFKIIAIMFLSWLAWNAIRPRRT